MIDSLALLSTSASPEAIHDLRLHVKKIKAIELLCNAHKEHLTTALKPMVQKAGEIRTAEMHLQILRAYQYHNPVLEQELIDIVSFGYVNFKKNSETNKAAVRSAKKKWGEQLADISDQKALGFLLLLLEELEDVFRWLLQEKDLHETRKKIKHLLYVYRFLPHHLLDKVEIDEAHLDKLQEKIGDWHDLEMTLLFLQQNGLKQEPVYRRIKKKKEPLLEEIKEVKLWGKR